MGAQRVAGAVWVRQLKIGHWSTLGGTFRGAYLFALAFALPKSLLLANLGLLLLTDLLVDQVAALAD